MKKRKWQNKANINGAKFEEKSVIKKLLTKNGYRLSDNLVYLGNKLIGMNVPKAEFYTVFLASNGIDYRTIIDSRVEPDECFVNFIDRKVYAFEKKWQEREGSVDLKLRTGWYAKKILKKCVASLGYDVEYTFVLCNWFMKNKYRAVLEDMETDQGCKYTFDEITLQRIGL